MKFMFCSIFFVVLFAGDASGIRRNFNRRIINSFKKLESAIEGLNFKVDAFQNETTSKMQKQYHETTLRMDIIQQQYHETTLKIDTIQKQYHETTMKIDILQKECHETNLKLERLTNNIGSANENYLRQQASKMFGNGFSSEWTSKSVYNLVSQVKNVLKDPEDDGERRAAALKLCPHLASTLKIFLDAINSFMVSNYNTSVASKDSNFSHRTLFSEYLRAINNEVPVNKARRHILLRINSSLSVLESSTSPIDWEPLLSCNGPGVMLAVINVNANEWIKSKGGTMSDYLATIKDPLEHFKEEIQVFENLLLIILNSSHELLCI